MQAVLKTDQGARQLDKCEVGVLAFFPAHEQPTRAIEPRMQAFHHPPARRFQRVPAPGIGGVFTTWPRGREAALIRKGARGIQAKPGVQVLP